MVSRSLALSSIYAALAKETHRGYTGTPSRHTNYESTKFNSFFSSFLRSKIPENFHVFLVQNLFVNIAVRNDCNSITKHEYVMWSRPLKSCGTNISHRSEYIEIYIEREIEILYFPTYIFNVSFQGWRNFCYRSVF